MSHVGLGVWNEVTQVVGTQDKLSLFSSLPGLPLMSFSRLPAPYLDLYDPA